MQNGMPMTLHRSKSKPEIKFQYGGRTFSKTGSSFISAKDWGISSKFGMQIEFHILKQILSLNQNLEVHFRLYGRHLEKSIWRHYSAEDRPITTKFGRQMQNDMPMTIHGWKSKLEIEFQYGGRPFSETDSFASFFTDKISKLRLSLGALSTTISPQSPAPLTTPPSFSTFKSATESEISKILLNFPNKQSDSDPIPTWLLVLQSSFPLSLT